MIPAAPPVPPEAHVAGGGPGLRSALAVRGQGRAACVPGDRDRGTDRPDIDRRLRRRARALDRDQARLVLRARVPQGRDRRDRCGRSDRPDLPRVPVGDGLRAMGALPSGPGGGSPRGPVVRRSRARRRDGRTRVRVPDRRHHLVRAAAAPRRRLLRSRNRWVPRRRMAGVRPARAPRDRCRRCGGSSGSLAAGLAGTRVARGWMAGTAGRARARGHRRAGAGGCETSGNGRLRAGRVVERAARCRTAARRTMPCWCRTSRSSSSRRRWEGARS